MKYLAIIMGIVLFFFSCADPIKKRLDSESSFFIVSPEENQSLLENSAVFFSCNSQDETLIWKSDISGIIGRGGSFICEMEAGRHKISLLKGDIIQDEVYLVIEEVSYSSGGSLSILVLEGEQELLLPQGRFLPQVISLSQRSTTFSMASPKDYESLVSADEKDFFLDQRNFRMPVGKCTPNSVVMPFLSRSISGNNSFELGDKKNFIIADTSQQSTFGNQVEGLLVYQNEDLQLWLDEKSTGDPDLLAELWWSIAETGYPRVKALWGEPADVNGNGRVDVLVSPNINEEEVAIGFFNPGDFHPFNDDLQSNQYNSLSNEMDILYLAEPAVESESFAYSIESLTATFCHEYFHMINYSRKVYYPELNGKQGNSQEEVFLDEGLAHLTESLCGFGESGGNLAFFSRYLENPGAYSINGDISEGSSDSVGRRGGVAAFLSWIFWSKGGIEWSDGPSSIEIVDRGGMAFLEKLGDEHFTGWENINDALDTNADLKLQEWFSALNQRDISCSYRVNDPVNGQVLNMPAWYSELFINGKTYPLDGPLRVPVSVDTSMEILPYSSIFYEELVIEEKKTISIDGKGSTGFVKALFFMP